MYELLKASFCIVVLVCGVFTSSQFSASAENYQQVLSTDKGSLKVGISPIPEKPAPGSTAKLKIDFLNPQSGVVQQHIDYTVIITKDGKLVFESIPLTHVHSGVVTIPVEFKENGEYKVIVSVEGILFQVIPPETITFIIKIGEKQEHSSNLKSSETTQDKKIKSDKSVKTKTDSKSTKNIKSSKIKQNKKQ